MEKSTFPDRFFVLLSLNPSQERVLCNRTVAYTHLDVYKRQTRARKKPSLVVKNG